jgi:hypothetical protein
LCFFRLPPHMAHITVSRQFLFPWIFWALPNGPALEKQRPQTVLPHWCPGLPSCHRIADIHSSSCAKSTTLDSHTGHPGRRPRHTPSRSRGPEEHCSMARRPGGHGCPPLWVRWVSWEGQTVEGASKRCKGMSLASLGRRVLVADKEDSACEYWVFQTLDDVHHR